MKICMLCNVIFIVLFVVVIGVSEQVMVQDILVKMDKLGRVLVMYVFVKVLVIELVNVEMLVFINLQIIMVIGICICGGIMFFLVIIIGSEQI